jgi:hypothetical protein
MMKASIIEASDTEACPRLPARLRARVGQRGHPPHHADVPSIHVSTGKHICHLATVLR